MTFKAWLIIVFELILSCLIIFILLGQIREQSSRADSAESLAQQRQDTINNMQTRQRDVAALDAKYTGELADAKATIDDLQRDVDSGKRRLQLNATCNAKSNTARTASLDNAASPRLTESALRDYFTLRERIETVTSQLTGLQAYVRDQCLK